MQAALAGKTAVITGASAGIGRATALALSKARAAVVVQARRSDRLAELVAEIGANGGRALAVTGDASLESDIDRLLEQARAWSLTGRIDAVVVNAGRGLAGGVLSSNAAAWADMYRLNVLGAAYLLRAAAEHMLANGAGDLVVLGSVSGRNVSPFSGFYGSTKFAVGSMAEALRREVCGRGVRVSLVMPGIVRSEFQQVAGYTDEDFGRSAARFGELLTPETIADSIAFILSLPPHVNVSEIVIRPTGQDYP